ncbi:hypothetical protein [Corynebacterium matruchotii]|nr:hypothetical protein [Corynebacterium matruchotii]
MSVKTATCSRVALLSSIPTPKVNLRYIFPQVLRLWALLLQHCW